MSGKASFKQVTPVIAVPDLKAAMEYYVEKLGFQVSFESEWEYNGIIRDGLEVHIGKGEPNTRNRGVCVYFMIENIDALLAEYIASGAVPADTTVLEQPYGMRELHVVDPFGHRIGFAEPMARVQG